MAPRFSNTIMTNIIAIAQIAVSVLLIILILLQERHAGAGGLFGGGGGEHVYQTRRGLERVVFVVTIILVAAFAGLAILNLIL